MPITPPQVPRLRGSRRKGRHAGPAPTEGQGHRTTAARSRPRPRRPGHLRLKALAASLLLFLLVAADAGAYGRIRAFLDYGAGVLALVSLTATVLWGLAATDRRLLRSDHRLVAQGVHRGLAVAGLGFLVLHVAVKVAEGRTTAAAAAVPFTDPVRPVLLGLGTLAGYLFLVVAVTGAVRSRFASGGGTSRRSRWRSRYWRALHMAAYPAWGSALVHGLKSGRPAAGWVTAAYALALVGVAVALALRLLPGRAAPPAATARITIPAPRRHAPGRPAPQPDPPTHAHAGSDPRSDPHPYAQPAHPHPESYPAADPEPYPAGDPDPYPAGDPDPYPAADPRPHGRAYPQPHERLHPHGELYGEPLGAVRGGGR
ncbi:hypothetical protein ACWCQL_08820 [Streptomyces sp. NPDC002073]